jgi:hypothetical protein
MSEHSTAEQIAIIVALRRRAQGLADAINALIHEFERDTTCTVFVEQVEIMDRRKVRVKAAI